MLFSVKYKKKQTDIVCFFLPVESSYEDYVADIYYGNSNVRTQQETCNSYI